MTRYFELLADPFKERARRLTSARLFLPLPLAQAIGTIIALLQSAPPEDPAHS